MPNNGHHSAVGGAKPRSSVTLQIHLKEIKLLKEEQRRLKKENKELRELTCFIDDERQRTKRLCREWQKFGRYTSRVMKEEVSNYLDRLHDLDIRQRHLTDENNELKRICLYLDDRRCQADEHQNTTKSKASDSHPKCAGSPEGSTRSTDSESCKPESEQNQNLHFGKDKHSAGPVTAHNECSHPVPVGYERKLSDLRHQLNEDDTTAAASFDVKAVSFDDKHQCYRLPTNNIKDTVLVNDPKRPCKEGSSGTGTTSSNSCTTTSDSCIAVHLMPPTAFGENQIKRQSNTDAELGKSDGNLTSDQRTLTQIDEVGEENSEQTGQLLLQIKKQNAVCSSTSEPLKLASDTTLNHTHIGSGVGNHSASSPRQLRVIQHPRAVSVAVADYATRRSTVDVANLNDHKTAISAAVRLLRAAEQGGSQQYQQRMRQPRSGQHRQHTTTTAEQQPMPHNMSKIGRNAFRLQPDGRVAGPPCKSQIAWSSLDPNLPRPELKLNTSVKISNV